MKRYNLVLFKSLAVCWVLLTCLVCGCEPGAKEISAGQRAAVRPLFYPGPPEKPRIQFLTSFGTFQAAAGSSQSAMDKFLFGAPETREEGIVKPYGFAIFEGKLYVCDVGRRAVKVMDLKTNILSYLTRDRRLMNPVNIYIENDGTKYITDSVGRAIFVFDRNDKMKAILGKDLEIKPVDIVVRGRWCYITDINSNQVVVIDKKTGSEIMRMGKSGGGDGEFKLISDLDLDQEGNVYVTDKALGKITIFNKEGIFQQTIGDLGSNIGLFGRPKGIAIDNKKRIWVVDAASAVAKIYTTKPELLLYFGAESAGPGAMEMPTTIVIDYDHLEMFKKYAVEGAKLEFLVFVSDQYRINKISVYGFGEFPEPAK